MSNPYDAVATKLISEVEKDLDDPDKTSTRVKNLKTFVEAQKLAEPEAEPIPEPTGMKAFFEHHSGDLIKVVGTLVVVSVIAVIEAKGDVIFRSKASKFI